MNENRKKKTKKIFFSSGFTLTPTSTISMTGLFIPGDERKETRDTSRKILAMYSLSQALEGMMIETFYH